MSTEQTVPNGGVAAVRAFDVLEDAGCRSIRVDTPHRTRGTWIVPATCDGTCCESSTKRIHIDPRTGATRLVDE